MPSEIGLFVSASSAAAEVGQASLIALMSVVHVLGFGTLSLRLACMEHKDPALTLSTVFGAGFTALGLEMWLLGYLNGWNCACFVLSTLASAALFVVLARPHRDKIVTAAASVSKMPSGRLQLVLLSTVMVTIGMIVLACARPPLISDELEYHWPGPLAWADAHHWIRTSFKYLNGPSLVELLYLIPALFNNAIAGHAIHVLLWFTLLLACCALGHLVGTPAIFVLGAVMACPVLTTEAPTMLNDLGTTALLLSSFAVLLSTTEARFPLKRILLASFIFCGALSSKPPFALVLLPLIVLFLACQTQVSAGGKLRRVALFLLPCLLTVSAWCAHTYMLTGKPIDIPMSAIWSNHNRLAPKTDPKRWFSINRAAPPSSKSVIALSLTPFLTPLFGNQEPYGGRTGFVAVFFLPLFIFVFKYLSEPQKHYGRWLLGSSFYYFLALGALTVRTRYHSFAWALWSVLAASGFWLLYNKQHSRRKLVAFLFCLLVVFGCVDSCRTVLLWNPQGKHVIPFLKWLMR